MSYNLCCCLHNGLKGTVCKNKYSPMTKLIITIRISSYSELFINRSQCSTGDVFVRIRHMYYRITWFEYLHFWGFHHFLQKGVPLLNRSSNYKVSYYLIKTFFAEIPTNYFSSCHFWLTRTILFCSSTHC